LTALLVAQVVIPVEWRLYGTRGTVYSYYRFVLEPELEFTEDTGAVSGPFAQFDGLPLKPLLTLGMDPPESWLVESVHAVYDLDNICMNEVTPAVIG